MFFYDIVNLVTIFIIFYYFLMYGVRSSKRKALVGTLSKKLLANSTNNSTALSIKYFPKVGINDLQLPVRKSDKSLPKTIWMIACKHSTGITVVRKNTLH